VVAATLAFFGSVYAAWRANNTNRREHAVNTGKLDAIAQRQSTVIENQETIRREVSFIRADVTDIHGVIGELRRADHDTDARVTRLERHQPQGEQAS
jgi:hypothetical protein